jgi:two-component system, OmpR family, response regulator RpaA
MSQARILLIDDDTDLTDAMAVVLESAGYAVDVANDGPTGTELAHRVRPDLIVLDIMMSYVLEGLDVGVQLQADPSLRQTPILMLSAIAQTSHMPEFPTDQPLPARYFLTKPVLADQLLSTVKWMLAEAAATASAGTQPAAS